jgi:uncharacterized membrane protein YczE
MKSIVRNYGLLFISIFIVGTAITLITNAGLGATAVTSLPYVISQLWDVSFGLMTGLFNVLWVVLQMAIQRRNFPKIQILQFLVAFILGFSVDLSNALLGFIQPQTYFSQIIMLVIGCLIMSFGVFLQLEAKAVYNPAEGIVAVITENTKYPFGTIKTVFDSTLVILSILLGLVVAGQVTGIREGTIISALIIGPFTGMFQKIFYRK